MKPWSLIVLLVAGLSLGPLAHARDGGSRWRRHVVNRPATQFTLTNQDGHRIGLTELRGKVILMTFIYTNCPEACPLITGKVAEIHESFKKDVVLLSVSIDPDHDTPETLKEYGRRFHADFSRWHFLVGTPDESDRVQAAYQVPLRRKKERDANGRVIGATIVDHGAKVFLVDRQGRVRFEYWGHEFDTKAVKRDLAALLRER